MAPAIFIPYLFFKTSRTYYILRGNEKIGLIKDLKIQNAGLPAVRILGRHLKPTTEFVQNFGIFATQNVLNLHLNQLKDLASLGEISLDVKLRDGFHILRGHDAFWGIGLVKEGTRLISYLSNSVKKIIDSL
ncbi:hypothetical protein DBT_1493 [Dissulfuribacter thermophilus]|uniref:Uncharacterized protein n=2 Tax=Dissulfuribacter thermophilus TaxID=1156395 RepID=A0A1B9F4Y6_9BACT|nr:hypothetical protein DBT_1493 [Dissulfuribacter thermophilus]